MLVYAVLDSSLSRTSPLGGGVDVFVRREGVQVDELQRIFERDLPHVARLGLGNP